MQNSQKMIKILIGIIVLIMLLIAGYNMAYRKDVESKPQNTTPVEEDALESGKANEQTSPSNTKGEQTDATTPSKESTPAERVNRTVSPSDAASYSEEDLPEDF